MPFGKLYTRPVRASKSNTRSIAIRAVAKANGLDLEQVEVDPKKGSLSKEYLKINKLGKIPSFVGADGFELTEAIAIAVYVASQNDKTTLLGKTKQDYASILRWMSFANSEIQPQTANALQPLLGLAPYNKKNVEDALKAAHAAVHALEEHLLVHTYLVGARITLADLFVAGILTRGFDHFFDKKWREENPNVTRWYETIYHEPNYAAVVPKLDFIDQALKNQAPKREEKPKQEKSAKAAEPKPKAAAKEEDDEEEEEEEDKPAPKPKHPLEALPKAGLPLDEWKRKYSNEDTPVALKWFWENYNAEDYSLWRVDYKYNDELTMTFMSSNLIGGFFARLEASRKYIFGAASVFGVTNDSIIQGAFVIRGQNHKEAFDVAPDFESYEFSKLDASKPQDKAFVDSMWSWEEPIDVKGKKYEWADGKVFK